jgi:4-hydroxythreonine-4-phosphate dehydrogenase
MNQRQKPLIAVIMGDPAGIGPEITIRSVLSPEILTSCQPIVIGDARILRRAFQAQREEGKIHILQKASQVHPDSATINILDTKSADPEKITIGRPSATGGRAVFEDVGLAVRLANSKEIGGIVAGPHNKYSVNLAGIPFAGYPPLFAKLTGSPQAFNMLVAGSFRIVGATLHLPLKEVSQILTADLVFAAIEAAHEALRRLKILKPRIAVTGLNPHCGEEGLFGDEEETAIRPAIARAQHKGIDATGPFPADSLFARIQEKQDYDAYVAMYHDQSHIAIKTVSFDQVAGLIIGIPLVAITVGHGSAFEIAGKGTANPASMKEAILLAAKSFDL